MPQIEAFYVRVVEENLYLIRKANRYLVWLGQRRHIEALDDESLQMLIEYRLAFDARCCQRVC